MTLEFARQLTAAEFNDFDVEGKLDALHKLNIAGDLARESQDNQIGWNQALSYYRKVIDLTREASERFRDLEPRMQGAILTALLNSRVVENWSDKSRQGNERNLARCRETVNLAGQAQIFVNLIPEGRTAILRAMQDAGSLEVEIDNDEPGWSRALNWFFQVISLAGHTEIFSQLNAEGKAAVLRALNNLALVDGWLKTDQPSLRRHLHWAQQAVALGGEVQVFANLNQAGKEAVIKACDNAGFYISRLEGDRESWQQEHKFEYLALSLAGQSQTFADLGFEGKEALLNCLFNLGASESKSNSRAGWLKAVHWFRQMIRLGDECYGNTSEILQGWVCSYVWGAAALRGAAQSASGWIALYGVLSEHCWREEAASGIFVPAIACNGSDLWLQREPPILANPVFSEHSRTVEETARVRLAQLAATQRQEVFLSWCLHEKWPVQFESLGHWVLAHVAVFAPHLLPSGAVAASEEQDLWQPDVPAVAEVLQWTSMWSQESWRAPYYLADLLPSPQILRERYDSTVEHQTELNDWFKHLSDGDSKPMAEGLQAAWLSLMDDQLTGVERLHQWLMRQGIDETDAWQRARDAILTASCDGLLQEVLAERWMLAGEDRAAYRSLENARLTEAAAATRGHTPLQAAMQHNLRFFANAALNQMLVANATEGAGNEDRLWELLQLQRLGVALAIKPKRPVGWSAVQGLTWDSQAESNIQAMQTQLLARAQLHEEARQRGEHLPKADERNEPLEPFATYAREWRRMGWDLVLPTPQQTAGCLREGQALVQLHLSEDGTLLHALLLRAGTGGEHSLSLHELGSAGMNVHAVTQAARQWQQSLAERDAVLAYEQSDSLSTIALSEPMQTLQYQWQAWQQPSHPLQAVMRWLHEQGPKGVVCVWPQTWSSLPWQALWAQAFEQAEPLRCVASVGAWVQARTRTPQEGGSTETLEPVVLSSLDVWKDGGESEVWAIARTLGVEPQASNDLSEVMKALKARGPVHLAMHGQFDALDPWRSALVVEQMEDGGQGTRGVRLHVRKVRKAPPQQNQALGGPAAFETAYLPAWALSQVAIQADITLGVCESLQEGQGEGQAAQLGAAGFGAMLMAAGARSVTGSLWACDAWSAAMFFDFWYEERHQHPAALALQKAQKRLRELDENAFLDRVRKASPEAEERAQVRCKLAKDLGWAKPFEHPFCWAAFALLGEAPALQLKQKHAQKTSMAKTIMNWLASWWPRRSSAPAD